MPVLLITGYIPWGDVKQSEGMSVVGVRVRASLDGGQGRPP